ncbi:hypothetical protein CONPUDRAFT_38798, partial [Coniophora puteana RWD-64-598 SS2]
EKFVSANGLRKCFHTGGNSSIRVHCRQHYALYKSRCEENKIPLSDRAIPRELLKKQQTAEAEAK